MKLSVIISIVPDPAGRKALDGTVYDVFKIEAIYTNTGEQVPPTMSGWEDNDSKVGVIYKYIAYADSLADVESKISTLNVSYWSFPPTDTSSGTTDDNLTPTVGG